MGKCINFVVDEQELRYDIGEESKKIIAGTKGYLSIRCTLSQEWAGCAIVAKFTRKTYDLNIECPVPLINGCCKVPDSMTDYESFYLQLIGADGGYKITTNEIKINQCVQ